MKKTFLMGAASAIALLAAGCGSNEGTAQNEAVADDLNVVAVDGVNAPAPVAPEPPSTPADPAPADPAPAAKAAPKIPPAAAKPPAAPADPACAPEHRAAGHC